MPPFSSSWADLPLELLCLIGESLDDLHCYTSARGACTAWRRALAPPSPSLLLLPVAPAAASLPTRRPSAASLPTRRPCAASLPTRRCFELKPLPSEARCVGSSAGWLALSVCGHSTFFSLFNPVTAAEIPLPPLIHKAVWAGVPVWTSKSKLVFAPNPAADDFAAAAICDGDRLAYVTAGARRWAVLDPVPLAKGDQLADLVYHEQEHKVYCLTRFGDVHVLTLPERRRREPIALDDDEPPPDEVLTPPREQRHYRMIRMRLLTYQGKPITVNDEPVVRQIMFPTPPPDQHQFMIRTSADTNQGRSVEQRQHDIVRWRSFGPDLNAPATVEPLLSLPFDPATSFAPPCNKLSAFTGAKNLVFCEGHLYQVWRNASCTVTVKLPGGGRRRVAENEVLVLRYYPQRRQPCWDVVPDLGGHSVFVGRNNAVSIHAPQGGGGVSGIKGDCVYWIGGRGRDQGMVYDMATGRTTACLLPPPAAAGVGPQTTFCWYVLSDNCNNDGGKRVYQTRADGGKQQDSMEE